MQMAKESSSVTASLSPDRCSVIGCPSHTSRIKNITFHSCPDNSVTQKLWLQSLKLDPKVNIQDAMVCSEHFDPSCFKHCGDSIELREGSIPAMKLKRKVRPNPKYADEETPSKKLRTEIKIETDSAESDADSPAKNDETAKVPKKTPAAKIVKRGPVTNTLSPPPLENRMDTVCLLPSPDGVILVKMEDTRTEASASSADASSNISKITPANATMKERIRGNLISKALAKNTVIEGSENGSTSSVSEVILANDPKPKKCANTIIEDDQNGSTPGVAKVTLSNDPKLKKSVSKNVDTVVSADKSIKKSNPRKVMASDEEVAQWIKDYKAECLAKQAKLEKSRLGVSPANTRIVPARIVHIPSTPAPCYAPPPSNGAPRRFASKLSQCVNEEGDDAHYVISKINFAMKHVQMQDRKIKELNDRYVELTRENDELREEHNSLRAQIAAAAKRKTGGVGKTIVVSKPVTSAETVDHAGPASVSSNVRPTVPRVNTVTTAAPVSTVTCATADGSSVAKPAGGVIIIRRKDSVETNTSSKTNVGGGDAIS